MLSRFAGTSWDFCAYVLFFGLGFRVWDLGSSQYGTLESGVCAVTVGYMFEDVLSKHYITLNSILYLLLSPKPETLNPENPKP